MALPPRIVLGVSAGIAAYKSCEVIRLLRDQGVEVQVVMTSNASQFISATTLQALSGREVRADLWDCAAEAAMGHIELARWGELLLIAPATADCLAQLAHGHAHDLLSTVCLASSAPLVIAPAMNRVMWQHPATRANVALLRERGVTVLGPAIGSQACGDVGPGRMLEPAAIVAALQRPTIIGSELQGKTVMITAGPTRESIDPVRFLSNHSSGTMGYALAEQATAMGAKVILISGPTALDAPEVEQLIKVETAAAMHQAVMQQVAQCDLLFAVAAVADYCCKTPSQVKLKKHQADLTLSLQRTVDIVKTVCALEQRPFVIAFAAETDSVLQRGREKLQRKGCDLLVVNDVSEGKVFGAAATEVTILGNGVEKEWGPGFKADLAQYLLHACSKRLIKECDTTAHPIQ